MEKNTSLFSTKMKIMVINPVICSTFYFRICTCILYCTGISYLRQRLNNMLVDNHIQHHQSTAPVPVC